MTARRALALALALLSGAACADGTGPLGDDGSLVYVALGDSYTSGPGVPDRVGPRACGRSDSNYPHLVAAAIGADVFRDVSCSGARLDDVLAPQDVTDRRTVAPQLDALDEAVDIVTIGMGGNDVGFISLARDCLILRPPPLADPCTDDLAEQEPDPLSEAISAMGDELAAVLDAIEEAAPRAEIFVVGYPTALPDSGDACWPIVPILQADMPYLVERYREMNAELATQAFLGGATFVDVYSSSIGHDVCARPDRAWVSGVVGIRPGAPAHPNRLSFENSAREVVAAISGVVGAAPP